MKKYKKYAVEILAKWILSQSNLSGEKITPRDFDAWVSGYIAAATLGQLFKEDIAKEIVEVLINSEPAKIIGVTGTLKESYEEIDI